MVSNNKEINDNLEKLLKIISNAKKEDVKTFYNLLKRLEKELPNKQDLEQLKEKETDIEIKYEEYYEIGNYFDPIYIEIKRILHEQTVNNLRMNNRKKRDV